LSVIFYLSRDFLKLYKLDKSDSSLDLIDFLIPKKVKTGLYLSENFESFWQKNFESILKKANNFYFLIDSSSGFSDTRSIYIWLKNYQYLQEMFDPKNNKTYFIYKLENQLALENLNSSLLKNILKTAENTANLPLIYSKKPKIGTNFMKK